MQLVHLLQAEISKLDFTKNTFLNSLFFMLFNPLFWNIAARLEYKDRLLSRLARGNSLGACYVLAACIFSLGLYRDYLYFYIYSPSFRFTLAVKDQPETILINETLAKYIAPILIFVGNTFVLLSTYRLGIVGTYLGDYFGFLMESKVVGFPYNVSEHPMYEGSTMIFLGYSLW